MNSSLTELEKVLYKLADGYFGGDPQYGAADSGLAFTITKCRHISEKFEGVNSALHEGWNTSAEVFNQIFRSIREDLFWMHENIYGYIQESYLGEQKEAKALEDANNAAQEIAKQLSSLTGEDIKITPSPSQPTSQTTTPSSVPRTSTNGNATTQPSTPKDPYGLTVIGKEFPIPTLSE